jgi:hypothetical protein
MALTVTRLKFFGFSSAETPETLPYAAAVHKEEALWMPVRAPPSTSAS